MIGPSSRLTERGRPVPVFAHVDTICTLYWAAEIVGGRLYHDAIDDRLGLEVIPTMRIPVDLLLTTDEEDGCSMAAYCREG